MDIHADRQYWEIAIRGKYQRLFTHLCRLRADEWRATFGEIETILGFPLPASARLHRPWWANRSVGAGHSQALAWSAAGWETAEVDMNSETLLLRRRQRPGTMRPRALDAVWPVHRAGAWPQGLSLRREDIYDDRP